MASEEGAHHEPTRNDPTRRAENGSECSRRERVHGTGEEGFLISVFMLALGEEEIVATRVREIFGEALARLSSFAVFWRDTAGRQPGAVSE